jgi:hypothetical protein
MDYVQTCDSYINTYNIVTNLKILFTQETSTKE